MNMDTNNQQGVNPIQVPQFLSDEELQKQNVEEPKKEQAEEVYGEHDIVIEEDFQLNLDVSSVKDVDLSASNTAQDQTSSEIEIGTEQTGNITF